MHRPLAPAVHAERAVAELRIPGPDARALPVVTVRQPVPAQSATASAKSLPTEPAAPASQAPVAAHVAVPEARTFAPAIERVVEVVRVAQPAALPSSHVAEACALVAANRSSGAAPGADTDLVVPTLICARHSVVPTQRVLAVAVLRLLCRGGPAAAFALPVTAPVQPASGQSIWELAPPVPDMPGRGLPFASSWPASRRVETVASLPTAHPDAAAVQVPVVVDRPGSPAVAPVVRAVQPGPSHSAAAEDSARVAGALVTGFLASSAARAAALRVCSAEVAAAVAAFFCCAVAPGRAAVRAASAASRCACAACSASCSASSFCCSATMSATTWPDAAVELVCARQPDRPLVQVALVAELPCGGPRAPFTRFVAAGPSEPAAVLRAVPEQEALPAQSRVAEAIVQLEAPGTVGPPEFALDPGAVGAGGVTGWSGPAAWSCGCPSGTCSWASPVVPEATVAFAVERCSTSGAMLFASGPDDAAEFVTAWHTPPLTPSHEPSECEPRGCAETGGSVAVAALATLPVQLVSPSQVIAAPAADAADGPAGIRAALTCWPSPARASAAPGPLEACDVERTSQPPVAPAQEALPCDVRGAPFATAPSRALVLVCTVPEQVVPAAHSSEAFDDDVDEGPRAGWPATGRPVAGSVTTKSGALDAAELASPEQPPPVTVQSVLAVVPRACGDTPVSRALVDDVALPPQGPAPPLHSTDPVACDTLTGPDTAGAAPAAVAVPESASRSATVVSVAAAQPPPAPRAVQDDEPVLLRTPVTSPDAVPVLVLDPRPTHAAVVQSTWVPALLSAVSSRPVEGPGRPGTAARHCRISGGTDPAASFTRDPALLTQPPPVAVHVEDALVVRTGAGRPAAAGVPVTFPVVFAPATPPHPVASPQSTLDVAELEADPPPGAGCPSRADSCVGSEPTGPSILVSLEPSHDPPRAVHVAAPVLCRAAPAWAPAAVPRVAIAPLPLHPAPQSTSTEASLPAAASSASAPRERLCAAHAPPATEQSAVLPVADPFVAAAVRAAAGLAVPASLEVFADPVQSLAVAQPTSASTTAPPCSPISTSLEARQPPLPSQWAAPLPRTGDPVPFAAAVVPAARVRTASARSVPDPVLVLSQTPPPDMHSALAPSRVAVLRCPHARAAPEHRADALVTSPSAPRLVALLPQPVAPQDAAAFDVPALEDVPHPDTPDSPTHRSESRFPSADSLTDPQPTNAPSEPHRAAAPSPCRSSPDTVRTSRPVRAISSSVAV
ncbi:hypothetical protein GCM10023320_49890 [Pseudonocardia adelaidensis]|uniref:Syndecan 1 n=1 Tax=Pseudonocardia adelaidensis TaxID=648754 RepID=A0ABP9NPF1_9PSEU